MRKAMQRQKDFDAGIVKRVADMARNLMESGYLRDLGNGDTKNLISAIKNSMAAGEKTYMNSVQRVFDIMVNNHLSKQQDVFEKLLHIKGSKVNDKGIEVQGQLDVNGQRILQTLKHSLDLPYEVYDNNGELLDNSIKAKMEKAAQNMDPDKPQSVQDEARNEFKGLQIAAEYATMINDSVADEKALRQSVKDAKAEVDAGNMDKVAYQQLCATVDSEIRKNRIDRAEAYATLTQHLGEMMNESISAAKDFHEQEIARIQEIQHNANSDLKGLPATIHRKTRVSQKVVNNSVAILTQTLASYAEMFRMLGSASPNGEGYLFDRFVRGWVDCAENERKSKNESFAILNNKAAEILGKGKKWEDLAMKVRKMKLTDGRKTMTVSVWDDGGQRDIELNQGNLMYIYMANKMADGAMKLRQMNITEEQVEQIANLLDPRMRELADWLQDEFYAKTREKYNEVHKRLFGASMAAIDDYCPLRILKASLKREEDIASPNAQENRSAVTTGAIIKRVRNNRPLDILNTDALNVAIQHVNDMEHWAAFSELGRDLNSLLSYNKLTNRITNMNTIFGGDKQLLNMFKTSCAIATGNYRPDPGRSDRLAVNVAKGATMAKVSLRVFTAWKQLASMPAYLSESNPAILAKNLATPRTAWNWSLNNLPLFEKRWLGRMSGEEKLIPSDMDYSFWQQRFVQKASKIGMSTNAFFDAVTVAVGAHSIYETRLNRYLKQGYDEEKAERMAKQDATILFNETQQSSESAFVSRVQSERSWFSTAWTVFRNASIGYERKYVDAMRGLVKKIFAPNYKEESIEFARKKHERNGLTPEQALRAAKADYYRSWGHDIIAVGIYGHMLQAAWYLIAQVPYLLLGSDEEDKLGRIKEGLTHAAFGPIEGLLFGDILSNGASVLANGDITSFDTWKNFALQMTKDMPLVGDLEKAFKEFGYDGVAGINDIISTLIECGTGFNPQTFTDAVCAVWDWCGNDARISKEFSLMMARIAQVPQSQLDKVYFDEINCNAEQAKKLTPAEVAERYADYKIMKGAGIMTPFYSKEARAKREDSYKERAYTKIKDGLAYYWSDEVNEQYDQAEADHKEIKNRLDAIDNNDMGWQSNEERDALRNQVKGDPKYITYLMWENLAQGRTKFRDEVSAYIKSKTPQEAEEHRQRAIAMKPILAEWANANTPEERDAARAKWKELTQR
jgi:hypothetical protein